MKFKKIYKSNFRMMKKQQTVRELLGLTQDELALVLQVSRSQFAKYELGMRDLPLRAKYLLAEMLQYLRDSETALKPSPVVVAQNAQKLLSVEQMLKENEYQRMATARKITTDEARYQNKLKALQLVNFLSLRPDGKGITEQAALRTISNKASKSIKQQGLASVFKLKMKLELLELEKLLLDAELRKILLNIDFIGNTD
ncbi:MAG: helix-turn-helix domain-containing protein [Flavobacterium sp.]|uniref:helix-turn-helix domain-containing protein n=1 Tax=Flavobacterium sp. TaxID=239 RepID=UPI003264BE0D